MATIRAHLGLLGLLGSLLRLSGSYPHCPRILWGVGRCIRTPTARPSSIQRAATTYRRRREGTLHYLMIRFSLFCLKRAFPTARCLVETPFEWYA